MSLSDDEDEIVRNFDEEAQKIVQVSTLPDKSADRYMLVYKTYKEWLEKNKNSCSESQETNLIVYFSELKLKVKPPTLWSVYSMLRSTLSTHDSINISNFCNLKQCIKNNGKGYVPKKSPILRWDHIKKFMEEASDSIYLVAKVIII